MTTKNPLAPLLSDRTVGSLGLTAVTGLAGLVVILSLGNQLPLPWKLAILLLAVTIGAIIGRLKPNWGIWWLSSWIKLTSWIEDRFSDDHTQDYDRIDFWQK